MSPSKDQLLLVEHKYLHIWLQPGGHWEPDETDPLAATIREAEEEVGLKLGAPFPWGDAGQDVPIDIDIHLIPANPAKEEPDHYHYDFRYVFVADFLRLDTDKAEYPEAKWFDLHSPEVIVLGKTIDKLRSHHII